VTQTIETVDASETVERLEIASIHAGLVHFAENMRG
jgi:hypothetical protein